ncbi:CoA transferase [Rhodococcus marinonascens]|uniref:CoA transferase n=1 Tax=Rhodococcus marinonascens TaxID=38311 RepID=UPI000932B3E2|nr:hypothetical protein [Rhodococcus marinonascens]
MSVFGRVLRDYDRGTGFTSDPDRIGCGDPGDYLAGASAGVRSRGRALDHATGYLLAAGIIDALTAARRDGRARTVEASLARTGACLLGAEDRIDTPAAAAVPGASCLVEHGDLLSARPALGEYADYPFPARRWGENRPAWE